LKSVSNKYEKIGISLDLGLENTAFESGLKINGVIDDLGTKSLPKAYQKVVGLTSV